MMKIGLINYFPGSEKWATGLKSGEFRALTILLKKV